MKKQLFLCWMLLGSLSISAQSLIGLDLGTSKSDNLSLRIGYQRELSPVVSAGFQLKAAVLDYRFIDARAVTEGNVLFIGIPLGFNVKSTDTYRVDINLTPSWRILTATNEVASRRGQAIEIDPNLVISMPVGDRMIYHAGVMLRTVFQVNPETLVEQIPSTILLNGFSYKLGENLFSLRTYVGPMFGAAGDTEKFFWKLSLGFQMPIGESTSDTLPFFNF